MANKSETDIGLLRYVCNVAPHMFRPFCQLHSFIFYAFGSPGWPYLTQVCTYRLWNVGWWKTCHPLPLNF